MTGGPCGGKTTALAKIANVVEKYGFHGLMVPECATIMKHAGALINPAVMTQE